MYSRTTTRLTLALLVAGCLAFAPDTAKAQNGWVARAAVNQYVNGAYGGYGYAPRYYGGYAPGNSYSYGAGNGYSYGPGTSYDNGGAWNGYRSSYPVFGYDSGYYGGTYQANPTYYGNRSAYYYNY